MLLMRLLMLMFASADAGREKSALKTQEQLHPKYGVIAEFHVRTVVVVLVVEYFSGERIVETKNEKLTSKINNANHDSRNEILHVGRTDHTMPPIKRIQIPSPMLQRNLNRNAPKQQKLAKRQSPPSTSPALPRTILQNQSLLQANSIKQEEGQPTQSLSTPPTTRGSVRPKSAGIRQRIQKCSTTETSEVPTTKTPLPAQKQSKAETEEKERGTRHSGE